MTRPADTPGTKPTEGSRFVKAGTGLVTTWTQKVGLRKPEPDVPYSWGGEADAIESPSSGLMRVIREAAATLDGLDPELREVMAHRTAVRDPRAQDGETYLRGPDGWWGGS